MTTDKQVDLLSRVLVPVASPDHARRTAAELSQYQPEHVTALHVIPKGKGGPAKTPVSKSGERGAETMAAFREHIEDIEMETAFGEDIVETILAVGADIDASAIVFTSRGGNRLLQLLSGDRTLKLVTRADRPVIVLPSGDLEK